MSILEVKNLSHGFGDRAILCSGNFELCASFYFGSSGSTLYKRSTW